MCAILVVISMYRCYVPVYKYMCNLNVYKCMHIPGVLSDGYLESSIFLLSRASGSEK